MSPRTVRNFWLSARIDGRDARLAGGPRSKDGGFDLTIYQRASGAVTEALSVLGREIDGRTVLIVQDGQGNELARFDVER